MGNCKYCKSPTQENFYFCPNCGKKLKEPPFKFSLAKSITIIIAAFLLPPFGIIPGVKYFLKDDKRAQFVGLITIGVTIIATGLMIIITSRVINYYKEAYNQIIQIQSSMNAVPSGNQQDLLNQIESLQN